jgi:hypothetical protein
LIILYTFDDSNCRGQFINTVGGLAIAGRAAGGVTRADVSELDTRSAEDAGIDEAVATLIDGGKYERTRRLLERHGVTHAFGQDTHVETADNDGVSTSDFAMKSESEFHTTAWVGGSEGFDATERDTIAVRCD